MDILHLEYQGKSAKVPLKRPPSARTEAQILEKTSTGPLEPVKVITGVNADLDPINLKPDSIINGDPELNLDRAGLVLEAESLSAAYFDTTQPTRQPVSNFSQVDVVFDAMGQEKERRAHLTRKTNIADIYPVKVGRRMPVTQVLTQFVIKHSLQIVHEDGVTMDFLFNLAKELHEKQEMALLGAGAKGNLPLVIRDKGSPYRGFLYGEIGTGDESNKYKLLVLLSDQELKRPAVANPQ
jgi:hypothetical protein